MNSIPNNRRTTLTVELRAIVVSATFRGVGRSPVSRERADGQRRRPRFTTLRPLPKHAIAMVRQAREIIGGANREQKHSYWNSSTKVSFHLRRRAEPWSRRNVQVFMLPPSGAILSPSTGAMPKCRPDAVPPKDAPLPKDVTRVVRVVIPAGFNPANAKRDVTFKDPAQDDTDDAGNSDGTPDDPSNPNPFHINLIQMDKGDGKYAKVRIILKDTADYSFYDDFPNIHGVGYGDAGNLLGLCGDRIETNKQGLSVAVFYVKINPDQGNAPIYGLYNIGLIPNAYPQTPIFIDPKIMNSG